MLDALPPPREANALPRPRQPRQRARQPVVGLAGAIGSGKSTAAKALGRHLGFETVAFAAPLKAMLAALGVAGRNLYGTTAEKQAPLALLGGKSAREAMRTLGTEWGRTLVWSEMWVAAWRERAGRCRAVVADDVRFGNEAEAVRAMGGIVIWIERPGLVADRSHVSDTEIGPDDCDLVLVNDGRPGDLTRRLKAALSESGVIGAKAI